MQAKEDWTNEIMDSIENIQGAETPSHLMGKIMLNVSAPKEKIIILRPMVKWVAAASIIFLAGINILSILQYNKSTSSNQMNTNPVYQEYFSNLNNF